MRLSYTFFILAIQVNLCQKLLFLHQPTHNMTTDCSLNYKFNTWKFQAQTWGDHVVYRNCFWHWEQFLYTTCSPHILTKIYLYLVEIFGASGSRRWYVTFSRENQPWTIADNLECHQRLQHQHSEQFWFFSTFLQKHGK